jgi:hypothetical protein
MGKGERVERVDIDVEALAFVPADRADHPSSARRLLAAVQQGAHTAALERAMLAGGSAPSVTVAVVSGGSMFRRLVDVPGARLGPVLRAWWDDDRHDDGHLRFDVLQRADGGYRLAGSIRVTRLSRRVPIELRLSPYAVRWSLLELTPRRATRASRTYFRTGHESIDRFVAALAALV